jgi:cell division septal protein FtsQ
MKIESLNNKKSFYKKRAKFSFLLSVGSLLVMLFFLPQTRIFFESIKNKIFKNFVIKKIEFSEIGHSNLSKYVSIRDLEEKLGLKKGDSLFQLSLKEIEERLKKNSYIEWVQIQIKLNTGLAIQYKVYQATALTLNNNQPWFVAENGHLITQVNEQTWKTADLPLILGFNDLSEGLKILNLLESKLDKKIVIHEIKNNLNNQIYVLIEIPYLFEHKKVLVFIENQNEEELNRSLERLKSTVVYLFKNNIMVNSIDLRAGQKVVVNVGKSL